MTSPVAFKLYHYPATRSARVKWLLHELLDDAFEVEQVQLYAAAQYAPAFLAKNPNHAVPALEVSFSDGSTRSLFESGALVTWLADAFPERGLAPAANELSAARADYLQMIFFGTSTMDMMLWQIRIHEHLLRVDQRDERTIARYRNKFTSEVEPQLKARLDHSPYICGDSFSAADCIICHNVKWARGYGMCQDPTFRQYLSRLSKRPAFVKAFSDARQLTLAVPSDTPLVDVFFRG